MIVYYEVTPLKLQLKEKTVSFPADRKESPFLFSPATVDFSLRRQFGFV